MAIRDQVARSKTPRRALHAGAAILAAITQLGAAAPEQLKVGDGQVDGRILQPYVNVWRVSTRGVDGVVRVNGAASDVLDEIWLDGRRYLTRTEGTTYIRRSGGGGGAFDMTFNVFDPVTLAPRLGEARTSGGEMARYEFSGGAVKTTTTSPGVQPKVESLELPEAVLDYHGGMTGLVLAALPLRPNYAVTLPALGEHGLEMATVRVVSREHVAAGHLGMVDAWRVQVDAHSTYWVRKTAPYVIKVEVSGPSGVTVWEMVR